ncbi:MAG: electron transport complex subunit RsxB [Gammaproteobacteria bacterium]
MAEFVTALLIVTAIAGVIGLCLQMTSERLPDSNESPVDKVNALLPQTQCAQCGYPGCRPYAEAIINKEADINQCAPGGEATVTALANLLGQPAKPLNTAFGMHKRPSVAVIREADCIGCALCLEACPVDAILGAHRYTHTVIRDECTGCELCLPPCPVDCIDIVPLSQGKTISTKAQAA